LKQLTQLLVALTLVALLLSCNHSQDQNPEDSVPNTAIAIPTDPSPDLTENPEAEVGEPIVEPAEMADISITIQFAGDVFMHQGPIDVARTGEDTFDFKPFLTHIRPFITADLAIANMEVPVDARGGNVDVAGWPHFNTPFEILKALQYAGFNHMITANNHAFDFGFEGIVNTVNSFARQEFAHTGMNTSLADFNTPTILDINGIQVGIVAYTDSVNGLEALVPEASRVYAVRRFNSQTLADVEHMAQNIADLREAGAELVILALHWGEEYQNAPTQMQRLIAAELSEAGADVIMGKHSHTVHPIEWHYREDGSRALIIYSLGNFLADQTRLTDASVASQINDSWGGHPFIGRTQFGMLVNLEITKTADGQISLGEASVLPTLCMRDFSGETLGVVDGVSVMPLVNGELPEFVTDASLRQWGQVASEHIVEIVGAEWLVDFSEMME